MDEAKKDASEEWKRNEDDRTTGSKEKGRHEGVMKGTADGRKSSQGRTEAQFFRTGGNFMSRGAKLNVMPESGDPTAREGELTPVNLRSVYPQDGLEAFDPRLPEIRRTPLPTNDMRRYLKQVVSRRH